MVIIVIALISCIVALLTSLVHYRSKFWNYFNISESAIKEVKDIEEKATEIIKKIKDQNHYKQLDFETNLKKKFKKMFVKKSKKLEKQSEEKYNLLTKNLEQEYNNACEEVKKELFTELEKVDMAIKNYAEELALKNILTFSCSCSKDLIPVAIDFSKENTFICPKCGSKYRIAINANPILIGRALSEEQFADLLEKRLNENKE